MSTSVIIPVRNGVRFIAAAVGSALPQLALDDEIIVVDDASTDATRSVLSQISDQRLRVVDGVGRGVSSARNIGLATAAGEFIAFLDHDDLWPPTRHSVLLKTLLEAPEVEYAVGRVRLRMEHDAILTPKVLGIEGRLGTVVSVCNGLFRKRILDQTGSFDEGMPFGEDLDYLLRLNERDCRVVLCDVDALIYRRHSSNSTCDVRATDDGFMQMVKRRRARLWGLPRSEG